MHHYCCLAPQSIIACLHSLVWKSVVVNLFASSNVYFCSIFFVIQSQYEFASWDVIPCACCALLLHCCTNPLYCSVVHLPPLLLLLLLILLLLLSRLLLLPLLSFIPLH